MRIAKDFPRLACACLFAACIVLLSGCASTYLDRKRRAIIDCTKELREHEFTASQASDICERVYGPPVE